MDSLRQLDTNIVLERSRINYKHSQLLDDKNCTLLSLHLREMIGDAAS